MHMLYLQILHIFNLPCFFFSPFSPIFYKTTHSSKDFSKRGRAFPMPYSFDMKVFGPRFVLVSELEVIFFIDKKIKQLEILAKYSFSNSSFY